MVEAADFSIDSGEREPIQQNCSIELQICVLGAENAEKSQLCNLIMGCMKNCSFKSNEAISEPKEVRVNLPGIDTSKSFYLVNTPDYWSSNKERNINFGRHIRELKDLSGIIVTLKYEESEDKLEKSCRNILLSLMQIYYNYVFDFVGIVVTNFPQSNNANIEPQKFQKIDELINKCIKEECGYGDDNNGKSLSKVQVFCVNTAAAFERDQQNNEKVIKIRQFCHGLLKEGRNIIDSKYVRENKKPQVYCILGPENVGKSSLCNALIEDPTRSTFKEELVSNPIRSKQTEMKALKKGTPDEYAIIDTFAFNGSFEEIKQSIKQKLETLESVNHYLLVLNGQDLPYNKEFGHIFYELIKSFGTNILDKLSIVFSNWETDRKSENLRKSKGFSEKNHSDQINSLIKKKVSESKKNWKRHIETHFIGLSAFGKTIEAEVTIEEKQQLTTRLEAIMKDCRRELSADKDNEIVPVICVLGLSGSGKSSVCNVLYGDKTQKKFPVFGVPTSNQKRQIDFENVTLKGKKSERNFMLVDTYGFSDSNIDSKSFVSELLSVINFSGYVKQFLLVVNSCDPRIDIKFKDMIDLLVKVFGQKIFKYMSVVFTHWNEDSRTQKKRAKENISKVTKGIEINNYLRSKTQDQVFVDCFFVDCNVFSEDLNDLEPQESKIFLEELEQLKEKCLDTQNEMFNCMNIEQPVFGPVAEEHKTALEHQAGSPDIYSKVMAKRREIVGEIECYFDSRDKNKHFTLYNDIYTTLENCQHPQGNSNLSDNQLSTHLKESLKDKIMKNLSKLIKENNQKLMKKLKEIEFLPKEENGSDWFKKPSFLNNFLFGNGVTIDELTWKIIQQIAYNEKLKEFVIAIADERIDEFSKNLQNPQTNQDINGLD